MRGAWVWGVAGGSLALCGGIALTWGYTVDDAFIVGRYANNLAAGDGWVFNRGSAPTDGVTSPLWLLPGVLAALLGGDAVVAAKLTGAILAVVTAVLGLLRLARRQGGEVSVGVGACLLAAQATFATWAAAGLGGAAAALCIELCADARRRAAPLAAAAMFFLRPELVPTVFVLLLGPRLLAAGAGRRATLLGLVPIVVGGLAVLGFRAVLFGDPLPLSLSAKPAQLGPGLGYLARAVPWVTGVGGLWLVAEAYRRGRRTDRVAVVALLVGIASVGLSGGDWMPGFRLVAPLLPLYSTLAGVGFARAWRAGRRTAPLCACLLAVAVPGGEWFLRIPQIREADRARRTAGVGLAGYLRGNAQTVALVDVGFLAYRSELKVLDLGGVTDPRIGKLPGGHVGKAIPEAVVREASPDVIVLHSVSAPPVASDGRLRALTGYPVERRVASMPWVRANYRATRRVLYASRYHYIVLARQEP